MADFEVAAVVSSIVTVFSSAMDVFKGMRVRLKAKKRSQNVPPTLDELRLYESLHRRPREIRAEYDRNVALYGHRFAIGDTVAQTSLAHTLLVLNTGLLNLINSALSDDKKKKELSPRSLLSLSEIAASDALNSLRQLNQRLARTFHNQLTPASRKKEVERKVERTSTPRTSDERKAKSSPPKTKARPKPPPPLVRGAWVRSKSGSSTVSAATSTTNLTNKKKSKSAPSSPNGAGTPKLVRPASPLRTTSEPLPCSCQMILGSVPSETSLQDEQESNQYFGTMVSRLDRVPSLLIAPSDLFELQQYGDSSPSRPPKIPLHSRPGNTAIRSIRPRPVSTATFMTASTKIGEIPEHRWHARSGMPWDEDRPLPYVIPPRLDAIDTRKKGRGFRFWKKTEAKEDIAAY